MNKEETLIEVVDMAMEEEEEKDREEEEEAIFKKPLRLKLVASQHLWK